MRTQLILVIFEISITKKLHKKMCMGENITYKSNEVNKSVQIEKPKKW
jgi:hypothetical protein